MFVVHIVASLAGPVCIVVVLIFHYQLSELFDGHLAVGSVLKLIHSQLLLELDCLLHDLGLLGSLPAVFLLF